MLSCCQHSWAVPPLASDRVRETSLSRALLSISKWCLCLSLHLMQSPVGSREVWPNPCSEWTRAALELHASWHIKKWLSMLSKAVSCARMSHSDQCFSWLEFVYFRWCWRRDYETKPPKLQLLSQIRSHLHKSDPHWTPEPDAPLDYCYVRPNHIPTINSMCQEFFWPGMFMFQTRQIFLYIVYWPGCF